MRDLKFLFLTLNVLRLFFLLRNTIFSSEFPHIVSFQNYETKC